ncbi:phosphoribosylanthranilate isomerase [Hymenobacter endophyticus]|uniref:N-(5'-phosphoribosyl)anthranilate isomerase n=1 Tax=Hymenobacter endophyticus TaxID=3076335 RepID=A0ABU3TJH9_9BACT|nr:phosphoribosylanthranilate isomerase [Hymenobacter endophyticus]MDU0371529.1 phosphoribosylanthranilate isomerase [Hymenobacter endophyticus]
MPAYPTGLRLKVCGMREAANIAAVAALQPDFLGFIFHPKSSRYAGGRLTPKSLAHLPANICKVGVFVDAPVAEVQARATELGLNAVQLHGSETPAECQALRAAGFTVLKAVAVGEKLDQTALLPYVGHVDYLLFDTAGPQPGGNGTAFNWALLEQYNLPVPYFLAGGLELAQADALRNLRLPGLFALDLNSKFELAPGLKDVDTLRQMFTAIRAAGPAGCIPSQPNS